MYPCSKPLLHENTRNAYVSTTRKESLLTNSGIRCLVHNGGSDKNTTQFHFVPKVNVIGPLQAKVKILLKTTESKDEGTIV